MKARPDTLLMLSGGLDSTYCLWQRVQRGQLTHVHHVHYQSRMGRQEVESRAVEDILRWLNANGGRGLIEYSESWMDFGTMWFPLNYFCWAFWIASIMAAPAGLNYSVIYPLHADDHPDEVRDSEAAVRTMVRLIANRTVDLRYPILHMTKRDIIAAMPVDLVALCWWCSQPWHGRPCHACDSCQLMDSALRASRETP